MRRTLANYVNSELKRIAFFLQYAGVIEDHVPNRKDQKDLMTFPVNWDEKFVLINGKKPSETNDDDYFYGKGIRRQKLPVSLQLKGTLKDRTFVLKIVYGDNRHFYYLDFEDGASYGPILTFKKMKSTIESISKGVEHIENDLDGLFSTLFKGKAKYNKIKDGIVSNFFGDYKNLDWQLLPRHQKNHKVIFLKFFTKKASPEEYKKIFKLFTEDDPGNYSFEVNNLLKTKVVSYVGNKIQDAGFDAEPSVSNRGIIKPKKDDEGNLSGILGFNITIK